MTAQPAAGATGRAGGARLEYILPLRRTRPDDTGLAGYLASLPEWVDVTVVDGSPGDTARAHARSWPARVRVLSPAPAPGGGPANGKVLGVLAGLAAARHECAVIADDDVRHTADTLAALERALHAGADVVRPQNHFAPAPWHARWDTARTLVNRALGSDYPGTLAVRVPLARPYRPDVLFENLELIRTVRARGGREVRANGLLVERRPPSARHFLSQRVRQAYDSLAQPGRLAAELALAPLLVMQARRPAGYLAWAAAAVVLAEVGRRRDGGAAVFPRTAPLWAPAWALERAVCSWAALGFRLRGGVPYAGQRLRDAATPFRRLRRAAASGPRPTGPAPADPAPAGPAPAAGATAGTTAGGAAPTPPDPRPRPDTLEAAA